MQKMKPSAKIAIALAVLVFVLLVIAVIITSATSENNKVESTIATETEEPTINVEELKEYKIKGVPVIPQADLKSGCETYACTMLLQYYKFDIDEFRFADNYLLTKPMVYGETERYSADLNCAFVGDVYTNFGWGIYGPAMAKSMNNYFAKTKQKYKAVYMEGIDLDDLCKTYVVHDIPVMIWGSTNMADFVEEDKQSWVVDYVDENAKYNIGDTFTWPKGEHCLVLIGFDEDSYFFCDSCAGAVSEFDKKQTKKIYKELGKMAIKVVETDTPPEYYDMKATKYINELADENETEEVTKVATEATKKEGELNG